VRIMNRDDINGLALRCYGGKWVVTWTRTYRCCGVESDERRLWIDSPPTTMEAIMAHESASDAEEGHVCDADCP